MIGTETTATDRQELVDFLERELQRSLFDAVLELLTEQLEEADGDESCTERARTLTMLRVTVESPS
jgi:hypothetical protein